MIIHIDLDDTLAQYSEAHARAKELNPELTYPQSQSGFYTSLEPTHGALEVLKFLKESDSFSPYIATAPSFKNPLSYTEKRLWIENVCGGDYYYVERLAITPNKGLLIGDILIDDLAFGRGQERFKGALWQYGTGENKDWFSILRKLKRLDQRNKTARRILASCLRILKLDVFKK